MLFADDTQVDYARCRHLLNSAKRAQTLLFQDELEKLGSLARLSSSVLTFGDQVQFRCIYLLFISQLKVCVVSQKQEIISEHCSSTSLSVQNCFFFFVVFLPVLPSSFSSSFSPFPFFFFVVFISSSPFLLRRLSSLFPFSSSSFSPLPLSSSLFSLLPLPSSPSFSPLLPRRLLPHPSSILNIVLINVVTINLMGVFRNLKTITFQRKISS